MPNGRLPTAYNMTEWQLDFHDMIAAASVYPDEAWIWISQAARIGATMDALASSIYQDDSGFEPTDFATLDQHISDVFNP